jgi:uncharacterized membrane protein YdjX (TVP38/TMEM64 family)
MFKGKTRTWLKLAALVGFLAAAVYYFRFTEPGRSISPEYVLDSIESHGPVTARMIYVAVYIVGTVLLLPGTVLSFAGAVLFGAYEGTLYTWIAAVVGSTLSFLLARWLGRDFVERLFGGRFAAFDQRIRDHGFTGLLIIRLLPLFPFNAVNFGCGLTGIRLRRLCTGHGDRHRAWNLCVPVPVRQVRPQDFDRGVSAGIPERPATVAGTRPVCGVRDRWQMAVEQGLPEDRRGQRKRHPAGPERTPE